MCQLQAGSVLGVAGRQVFTTRASRRTDGPIYVAATAVLIGEIIKFLTCCVILWCGAIPADSTPSLGLGRPYVLPSAVEPPSARRPVLTGNV